MIFVRLSVGLANAGGLSDKQGLSLSVYPEKMCVILPAKSMITHYSYHFDLQLGRVLRKYTDRDNFLLG